MVTHAAIQRETPPEDTRLHADKKKTLTQPLRLIGEIVDTAKKQGSYQAFKGLTGKDK